MNIEALKDMLTNRAIEKVDEVRGDSKPDFDDLGVGLNEILRVKKTHAVGGATTHKHASNDAQKTALTGKSKKKRKRQGKKLRKTMRRMGAGKKKRTVKKRNRAMKKKGTTFRRG